MSDERSARERVGEINPSQLMYAHGIGAIVELPNLSVMVMGVDDWPTEAHQEVHEDRLLEAVQFELGHQVRKMFAPPVCVDESGFTPNPLDSAARKGVPVAPFPRWMVCPICRLLAPLSSGLFRLRTDPYRQDKNKYVHQDCPKAKGGHPTVFPARFLVACEGGHLDDFPWVQFVHRGETDCPYELRLIERGVSGEAADIFVECVRCNASRSMAEAFTDDGKSELSHCSARWPHLRTHDDDGCEREARAILLGASNSWFPIQKSALSIPQASGRLARLVEEHWAFLSKARSVESVELLRDLGHLSGMGEFSPQQIYQAVEAQLEDDDSDDEEGIDLREPEWNLLIEPDPGLNGRDFRVRPTEPPSGYHALIAKVVLVERVREVKALIGFSRIESPGHLGENEELPKEQWGPLSRVRPSWVPATEVRGEGLFIQFREEAVRSWLDRVRELDEEFRDAHRRWRLLRQLEPVDAGYPTPRYILLHSFSHALMRQLSLECGYSTASIRERLYSQSEGEGSGPMAGVLLYTAAPDSEGTLGGLVSLGRSDVLGYHIDQALDSMGLCASDPLCAEHRAGRDSLTLHGAACHACLFAPETSCERGNKYLDRSVLVETVDRKDAAFFKP